MQDNKDGLDLILLFVDKLCSSDFIKEITINNNESLFEKKDNEKSNINISELNKLVLEIFPASNEKRYSYAKITKHILKKTEGDKPSKRFVDFLSLLQTISENLNQLIELFKKIGNDKQKKYNNASIGVYKLKDHIDIEIYRIERQEELQKKTEEAIKEKTEEFSKEVQNIKDNLTKMSVQYITILGIFASIVLAFVSGLAFSTSVLQNIDKVSIYRLIAVISLIAIFIVNILNSLFSFIKQIHYGKDDESSKFKPLNLFNIIMLLIIILTAVAWYRYHPYEHKTTANSTTTININASDLANCRAK
nr:MAG TPA: Synaptobrevin [Caudoviricetes sp.]